MAPELLPENQVLGDQRRMGRRDRQDEVEQRAEGEHAERRTTDGAADRGATHVSEVLRSALSSKKSPSSLWRAEYLVKNGDQVVGNHARVKVVKNKVAPPFREAEFDILYGVGVNAPGEVVDLASAAGLFEKAGAFYSFRGERIGQGRDKASAYVAEHPEIAEEVRRLLLEARKAENAALGAPVTSPAAQAQAA